MAGKEPDLSADLKAAAELGVRAIEVEAVPIEPGDEPGAQQASEEASAEIKALSCLVVELTIGILASRNPIWAAHPGEVARIGSALAVVVQKHAPAVLTQWGAEITLAFCVAGYALPRMQ